MVRTDLFQHEAMFYAGLGGFLAGTVPFLKEGVAAGEPTLVAVDSAKIAALRGELGDDARRVHFADMAQLGRNPARLIPAWQQFIDNKSRPGGPVRGVGEPIWAARSPAELIECQAHETLLNVAFADRAGLSLLCPYDVRALGPDVVEEARRSHPFVITDGQRARSDSYVDAHPSPARLDEPLPPAPPSAVTIPFGPSPRSLRRIRARVRRVARNAGLDAHTVDNVVISASELATNSLRYGGGHGMMRIWFAPDVLICEFTDSGHITGPALLGRQMPHISQDGGRGLWLVNQLCDLVQIRSAPTGTTIRVHIYGAAG